MENKKIIINAVIIICLVIAVAVAMVLKSETGPSEEPENVPSIPVVKGIKRVNPDVSGKSNHGGADEKMEDEKPLPRLLDLGAGKCIPCKMMEPILEELSEEYADQFEVEFIDVWKNRKAAREYGIKLIPTQIFFDASGTELFRHEGFYSKEQILAKWKELGIEIREVMHKENGV